MPSLLTPEQEAELRDWSRKAFAEAKARTERDMLRLNELSRKRAEEKFAWRADHPKTPRHRLIMDRLFLLTLSFLIGAWLMYLLLL